MKANRSLQARGRFGKDERAASEAIGYVVTFGISTVILITSLTAFNEIRGYATEIAMDRTAHEVSAQVAFAVEEALRAGATYPDIDFSMTINLPSGSGGNGYTVTLYADHVWVVADNAAGATQDQNTGEDLQPRGRAKESFITQPGAAPLCTGPSTVIEDGFCTVRSDAGTFRVVYKDPDGTGVGLAAGVFFAA